MTKKNTKCTDDKMQTQSDEFDAVDKLSKQWRRLQMTPIVDDDYPEVRHAYEGAMRDAMTAIIANGRLASSLTFAQFRAVNMSRCLKWHPDGIESWSASDWLTAVVGELGELASLIKMRNRERDNLPGNKFSPTDEQVADELADVFTYLDLLAASLNVDLAKAAVKKFNEVSERIGLPDRL